MAFAMQSRLLTATLALGLAIASAAVSAQDDADRELLNRADQALGQRELIQLLSERNAQALYSQLDVQAARAEIDRANSVFQPGFFSDVRYTSLNEPISETRDALLFSSGSSNIEEQRTRLETGVRVPVRATGADLVLSLANEWTIDDARTPDEMFNSVTSLQLTQPLLRGFRSRGAETQVREAELGQRISDLQAEEQLLRAASEALILYWQLYRVERSEEILSEALENAELILAETNNQIIAGRAPETARFEAELGVMDRQAELETAQRARLTAQNQLRSLLNLSAREYDNLTFHTADRPRLESLARPQDFDQYLNELLSQWPAYEIARETIAVEAVRAERADEDNRPQLDLALGLTATGANSDPGDALADSLSAEYPTWYVGLEFNIPLGPNQRGAAERRTADIRQEQAELDLVTLRTRLSNDLQTRLSELEQAFINLQRNSERVELYQRVYDVEMSRFREGQSSIRDLYDRSDESIRTELRHLDSVIAYQRALVELRLAEGSLLEELDLHADELITVMAGAV